MIELCGGEAAHNTVQDDVFLASSSAVLYEPGDKDFFDDLQVTSSSILRSDSWSSSNGPALEFLPGSLDPTQTPWLPITSTLELPSIDITAVTAQSPTLPIIIMGAPEATDRLITNWFEQVCPAWSAFDSSLNPNRKIAADLMHCSNAVFSTLQSMSASFLSARLPQMKRPALRFLKAAVASIEAEAQALRGCAALDTVPTSLLFSLLCLGTTVCWLDASRLGLPFLKEAKDLLQRVSLPDGDEQVELVAFFKRSITYWEMLLSFVDDYGLPGSQQEPDPDYLLPSPEGLFVNNDDLLLHPWTGISIRPAHLFAQSLRLCRAHRRRVSKPSGSEVAFAAGAQETEDATMLEERLLSLNFTFSSADRQTGDERTPWQHLVHVAEAYQLSSLLQLYLTFPDLVSLRMAADTGAAASQSRVPCEKWTIPLALRICKLLEQIPPESGSRVIQPMLYISASTGLCYPTQPESPSSAGNALVDDNAAGVVSTTPPLSKLNISRYIDEIDIEDEAREADGKLIPEMAVEVGNARSFIFRRLDSLECTLQPRPIIVAKELVKAIWAVYDDVDKGCKSGHWIDVLEAQGLRSLFG